MISLDGYVIFWMKTLHLSSVSYLFGRVTAPVAWPLFAEQEFFDILRKALNVLHPCLEMQITSS